jgi:hypothetical protein
MALVSITTVGSFTLVGAILVVAMLVVPAATAYLLTDDLKKMLAISVGVGVLSSTLGYLMAQRADVSIAGSMTVVAGLLFTLAFVFSPRHGVLVKALEHRRLSARIGREDALQVLWRHSESPAANNLALDAVGVAALTRGDTAATRGVLQSLRRSGLVQERPGGERRGFVLTEAGRSAAQELVHRHRVYETYLGDLGYPEDHVHAAADRVEHFISPQLLETMDEATGNPVVDPHGKPIPHDSRT